MKWSELDKNIRHKIFMEDTLFRHELETKRPEVINILSKFGTSNIPKEIKHLIRKDFIDSFSGKEDVNFLLNYKWHAQVYYNIYFRYGCELVYFKINKKLQPMVKYSSESNIIVPYGNGDISLIEYFNNYKNGTVKISINSEKQKDTFNKTMAYHFLKGKKYFFDRFFLDETFDSAISTEQLFYSYYIAWKNLNSITLEKPNDILEIGKNFLNDIFFKHPLDSFKENINYDFVEYILFNKRDRSTKRIKEIKELKETYYDVLPKVFQIDPHSFPVFDNIFSNECRKYGLLIKLNYELENHQKMKQYYRLLDNSDYKKLQSIRYEIEHELKSIINSTSFPSDIIITAESYIKVINGDTVKYLSENLIVICKWEPIYKIFSSIQDKNHKNHYDNIIHSIIVLWKKAANNNPVVFSNFEDDEGSELLKLEADDTEPTIFVEDYTKKISYLLLLFFKTANFISHGILKNPDEYISIIDNYLLTSPQEFRNDLYSYLKAGKTGKSNLQENYLNLLQQQGIIINQDIKTEFNRNLRDEIILPLIAEMIILYGSEQLKEQFKIYFNDSTDFLNYISNLINNFSKVFCETLDGLKYTVIARNDNYLQREYHEALFPDRDDMPPNINDLELRKVINEFIGRNGSDNGNFKILRNACLQNFPCFTNMGTNKLFKEYNKISTPSPIGEAIFIDYMSRITRAICKKEIIRYGEI